LKIEKWSIRSGGDSGECVSKSFIELLGWNFGFYDSEG
jgi:hypothetical protein